MAHFSNGTEGMIYQEMYCFQCQNYRDLNDGRGEGCPIWDLHLQFNSEGANNDDHWLHQLIPLRKDDYGNGECTMFLRVSKP